MRRYVGMDVHGESCTICAMQSSGKRPQRQVVETNGAALVEYFRQLSGQVHVCIEESEWSAWLWEILDPHVSEVVVVRGERRRGVSKSDAIDARGLAERLRTGQVKKTVYKAPRAYAKLRELARVYWAVTRDVTRTKNRLKSAFRRRGIRCVGRGVYGEETRAALLKELPTSMREAVAVMGEQLSYLQGLKEEQEAALVAESHRHGISRILETAPGLGPVRVAQVQPIVVTPYRFRTKRQFWAYSGFGIVTHSSSDWQQQPNGGWVRARVPQTRGLNRNFNRQLKSIFKGAATTVIAHSGTNRLQQDYERLCAAGTKPNLAKLTVARRIAAITLAMWKQQEVYDPQR